MGLISKYSDYYDYLIHNSFYDEDRTTWKRECFEVDPKNKTCATLVGKIEAVSREYNRVGRLFWYYTRCLQPSFFNTRSPDYSWQAGLHSLRFGILSVGDRTYPFLYFRFSGFGRFNLVEEDFLKKEFSSKLIQAETIDAAIKPPWGSWTSFKTFFDPDEYFDLCHQSKKGETLRRECKALFNSLKQVDFEPLQIELKQPSILYLEKANQVVANPRLLELGFQRVLDRAQAGQEIIRYYENILVSDELPPSKFPPQTDVDKIESHGFDKKTSFRRMPVKK